MKIISSLLLTALLGFTQTTVFGQQQVSGTITTKDSHQLPPITVELLSARDSSLIKTAVSAENGKYEVPVKNPGKYLLFFSGTGFEKKYSASFEIAEGQRLELPVTTLTTAQVSMQAVTVTSKKPMIEVKADKTVFNVEASINAQGSNALELLQKSPGIQVDNNDNITMKGKTGVRVYVDGKMMQLDSKELAAYLKSINSNDIEAIEMISNPSAKYDASGNAGIINLRLKKNKRFGTNGSLNLGFVQGVTPKGNGSVNLNYRDKKINVFGNIGGDLGRHENTLKFYRIQKDTLYDQLSIMRSNDKSINIKTGADFFINRNNTFGLLATGNFNNTNWGSNGNTDIYYNPTGTFIKSLKATNNVPGHRTNANFNINYRYADTAGKEINFDADYGLFRGTGRSYQPNEYYNNNNILLYSVVNRNYTPTDIDIYTAKIDVDGKLGKGKLGYGAKTSFVTTKNTFDFFNDDASGTPVKILSSSNSFTYKENVNAGYINYQRQFNPKWSLQAGLRAEQTNSEGILTRADGTAKPLDDVKRSYFDVFPSAALSYTINARHSLNLTYSRRIDRPTYQDLNPFENKLDELTYEKGNAFLRPQYTDNVELTHTFMGFLNTTVGYSHVKDYATQATDTINNATFVQQKNLATQEILNFSIGSPLPIKKWWNGYANFWYNYQMFRGYIGDNYVHVNIPSYGAYLQQSFTIGKGYTAELSGWFNGPSVWGGTWKTKSQGGLDVGLQKQLLKNKATLKLSGTDLLHTAPWKAINDFGGLYVNGGGSWESRTFRVSFSWRFGNSQVKSSRQRETGLENESKRIKGAN